jgi:hypothetical protein
MSNLQFYLLLLQAVNQWHKIDILGLMDLSSIHLKISSFAGSIMFMITDAYDWKTGIDTHCELPSTSDTESTHELSEDSEGTVPIVSTRKNAEKLLWYISSI